MSHGASDQPRIYLDNAATSWPKPESVYTAVDHYLRNLGAPAGRSGYAEAVVVSHDVEGARRKVAGMLGLVDPTHLIFTANGTDSLNLVIHGLLGQGDHVITSVVEHNSVLRPLRNLEDAGQITVTHVGCDSSGVVDPRDVREAIRPATRLVALCHASNVTGAVQPIAQVAQIAREAGVLVLCDGAQTVGHMPVDMRHLQVDFLAASGHKGLLGPLGTGLLAIRPDAARHLRSVRQGGTGTHSDETRQPDDLPGKFESGNLNVPGILGLAAAVDFLRERGLSTIHDQGIALTARLLDGFRSIAGLHVRGPSTAAQRVPLVSITLEGYDPQEVALSLDAAHRIQVRPGLHCAPAMHQAMGTHETGGTVRFSLGAFTTQAQINATVAAVDQIAAFKM
jgi:cysteine desulfurase / selenocysteine lyase